MRKILLFLLIAYSAQLTAFSQYWQQEVNYTISVSLNDTAHTLRGFEKIEYINNSPDTLKFIWFHIWPNAYKNDKTAFSDQFLINGNTKFYFSDKEQKGYINRLDFKVNNVTAEMEDHPEHIDIIKLVLPSPLPPRQRITITTPFHVKLPYNFSRGGHDGQSYQATQWYPKPAVYDNKGWHPMPYLDQGEFYSEFGSYDVSITVPENYVVAATGELQNASEKEWLQTRTAFTWEPVKKKIKTKGGSFKTVYDKFPPSARDIKTLRFKQNNIHDFAWFADKRFIVRQDTCQLSAGRIIDVFSYYTAEQTEIWKNSVSNAKDAIRHYSSLVGEYPYNIASVVQGPQSFGGGMEYPTITVISPEKSSKDLDNTIAHELGHNWFYGILASNERRYPWMDEGINTFYDDKYYVSRYGQKSQTERLRFETKAAEKTDQPINTVSETFSEENYYLIAYYKTSEWLRYVESLIGSEAFNKAMREYYQRWQFKHPQPEDLKKVMEEIAGKDLDTAFLLLEKKDILPNQKRQGQQLFFIPGIHSLASYINSNAKNIYTLLPAAGLNNYDKLMIGLTFTNLKQPPSKLQFLLAPMYAPGTKKFAGIGFINHSFYPDAAIKKVDIGVSGSLFTADDFTDEEGNKTLLRFQKIVPGIRLTLNEKNARSTLKRFVQFKTYMIGEDDLRFYRDTVITGADTTISNKFRAQRENRTLNQLLLVAENYRALYPYRGELKIEQGKDFVRTAFTGKYFFNYVKEGGLNVRLFAGKFFYTGSKTFTKQFATDRYHLNMTGANGYEDYTYSDYFIGRNEFEGTASQQIMERDGAFKVRTDLLASKVGRTDDWLMAVNFSSTIPSSINPLSLLPFKVPLKVFVDIGTYAEPWKKGAASDRFLFDAGLHIPILKETINIYVPLMYSSVFKDYIQSTLPKKNRLLKTISFSIDISSFSFRKFDRKLDF
ncbi:MAG: M1 family metallopeptidase [Chitinophagaceae bacterium]|nr:M1 family metallopeptidase [Chitinophagaceae bacterium]